MTASEALLEIEAALSELDWYMTKPCREAFDMAINALEKQVPKSPNWEGDGYSNGQMVYDAWYCPTCDTAYEDDDKHKYCPECGQRIALD